MRLSVTKSGTADATSAAVLAHRSAPPAIDIHQSPKRRYAVTILHDGTTGYLTRNSWFPRPMGYLMAHHEATQRPWPITCDASS